MQKIRFFTKRFKSIDGLPYFKLNNPYLVRVDPQLVLKTEKQYLVLNTEKPYFFRK